MLRLVVINLEILFLDHGVVLLVDPFLLTLQVDSQPHQRVVVTVVLVSGRNPLMKLAFD